MEGRNVETIGVRRTGWAALDRDPQQDKVEFVCPYCGARDEKNARRERALYHFTDGFLQVAVRSGEEANVDFDRACPAHPHEFAFLENAQ